MKYAYIRSYLYGRAKSLARASKPDAELFCMRLGHTVRRADLTLPVRLGGVDRGTPCNRLVFFGFVRAPRVRRGSGQGETCNSRASADSPSAEAGGDEIGRAVVERKRAEWQKKRFTSHYKVSPSGTCLGEWRKNYIN